MELTLLNIEHCEIETASLFSFVISEHIYQIDEYLNYLSIDEVEKANRFHFEKDRNCYIVCRAILRSLLSDCISVAPDEIIFDYNSYGKPELSTAQNHHNYNFNLSHSGNYGMIGISNGNKIGVDIEKHKDIDGLMQIAENYFSKREVKLLSQNSGNKLIELFYTIWTQKEALIKASGMGLSFGLDHWSIEPDENEYSVNTKEKDYFIKKIFIIEGYSSACCIQYE